MVDVPGAAEAVNGAGGRQMAIDEDAVPEAVDLEVGTAPVLVRPYVGEYTLPDTGDEADPDESGEPDDPLLPAAPRGRTRILRTVRRHGGPDDRVPVGRHARRNGRGPWLALLAASGATAVVLTVAAVVTAATGGGPGAPDASGRIHPPAPGVSRPGSVTPGGSGQPVFVLPGTAGSLLPRQTTAATGSTPTAPASQLPGGPTQSTGPSPTGPAGPAGPTTPAAQPSPTPPPPAVAITGQITNVAGLCLTAVSSDQIQLSNCDGTAGQSWTLATDGTLRVLGQCLQVSGSTLRLRSCNGGLAQQWRAGPALSLVNGAAASCLGDPQAGTASGSVQRTAPCDQSNAQRWTLAQAG